MATQWLRRAWLLAVCASALALAACGGGGKIDSQLAPSRVIVFGDATADTRTADNRYTVNGVTTNDIWTEYVAAQFGQGVTSYAEGNARVVAKPDAANNAATRTIAEQIDAFLTGGSFNESDLVLVSAGTSDIIAAVRADTSTSTDVAGQAGRDLAQQVRRLVNAGARHVGVASVYNLSVSAWAREAGAPASALGAASRKFNDQLKITMQTDGLGSSALYIDQENLVNLMVGNPGSYGFVDVTTPVCGAGAINPGEGIGTGTGQLDSSRCTNLTLVAGADPAQYLFADRVYLTPSANAQFGSYAYSKLRDRW